MSLYDWKQSSALEVPSSHKDTMVEIIIFHTPALIIHLFPTWKPPFLPYWELAKEHYDLNQSEVSISIDLDQWECSTPAPSTHHDLLDSENWLDISCSLSGSVCVVCPSDQTTRQNIFKIMTLLWSSRLVRQLCRLRYELVLSFSFNQDIDLMNF